MKKLLFSILTIPLFFSCSTVTKITNSDTNQMAAHESGIVMRPLLADLDVSQSRKSIEYIVPYYMNAKKEGKENALLQFKKTHKCDYVVDPVFEIVIETGKKNETKIIVNGYAASYSNIRQVDTLPESVVQYGLLPKNVQSLDYLNTFEEKIPTRGIEISVLAYTGIQYDQILDNSNNRFYLSAEMYGLFDGPDGRINCEFRDKSNDNLIGNIENLRLDSRLTLSGGLMREFPVFNFLKFRIQGGANLMTGKTRLMSIYDVDATGSYYVSSSSGSDNNRFISLGLRLGGGIDIKIYKSLSAIFKVHYNQNLLNTLSAPDGTIGTTGSTEVDYKIRKIKYEDLSTINLSAGLRIVF